MKTLILPEKKEALKPAYLLAMENVFSQFPELTKVVLFWSRAIGNFKLWSDVDLCLFWAIDFRAQTKIHEMLEEDTPIPLFFDVVSYDTLASSALREHIDTNGETIWMKK